MASGAEAPLLFLVWSVRGGGENSLRHRVRRRLSEGQDPMGNSDVGYEAGVPVTTREVKLQPTSRPIPIASKLALA